VTCVIVCLSLPRCASLPAPDPWISRVESGGLVGPKGEVMPYNDSDKMICFERYALKNYLDAVARASERCLQRL